LGALFDETLAALEPVPLDTDGVAFDVVRPLTVAAPTGALLPGAPAAALLFGEIVFGETLLPDVFGLVEPPLGSAAFGSASFGPGSLGSAQFSAPNRNNQPSARAPKTARREEGSGLEAEAEAKFACVIGSKGEG
jgi:hypothetical protein